MEKKKKEIKKDQVIGIIEDKGKTTFITEEITIDPRMKLAKDIVNFVGEMIGKSFMTPNEAKQFCNLYSAWFYQNPGTTDCRWDCKSCMIRQFPKLKEVYETYKNLK